MNMVEKCVVTFGFNNDNLRNFSTLVIQQPCGKLPNKTASPKTKGVKQDVGSAYSSFLIEQRGKNKCWRCDGTH
jgi:hypothetical protein